VERLQTTVQFLEKKRSEDQAKLREADTLKEKNAHIENVVQKLQTKCQSLVQENGELRKKAKTVEERLEELEVTQAEHDSILELAALDREMAEERAESYLTELSAIKGHYEELKLENDILKEEQEELNKDLSPEERASQGWLHLQQENARLRDAIIRLRDLSRDQAAELQDQISSLEEDSKDLSGLRDLYEDSKTQLLAAEGEAEDLREQLDAALGAEPMIEQLTEKNLSLSEQVEELRNTVDHLNDLQELNDELEINHMEHEKQLQAVIDIKETAVLETNRQMVKQEEELVDREYTILRFRDLVSALQSDLDAMRSSKEMTEQEAQNLESSSRAIMDLNRQLQASANSATVKALDIELGKLDAEQASEHLSIVQLFLPEAFQTERNSILALLRFRRIAFKSKLLHGFIKQNVSQPESSAPGVNLFAACDCLDKLTWLWTMCDRFTACIRASPLAEFSKFEGAVLELEPVERVLNSYLESLRKGELHESAIVDGLQRYTSPAQVTWSPDLTNDQINCSG
jgi:dynactin 1